MARGMACSSRSAADRAHAVGIVEDGDDVVALADFDVFLQIDDDAVDRAHALHGREDLHARLRARQFLVRTGAAADGLVFAARDFAIPIVGIDPLIYALATSFVETRYPPKAPVLSARVHANIERLLQDGQCTSSAVAAMLGMHPRTLQRRLRAEGKAFEAIKDDVRRDLALRYLTRSELPLIRVAELLGYSETSVLSRSCHRWFAASPRQVRAGAG